MSLIGNKSLSQATENAHDWQFESIKRYLWNENIPKTMNFGVIQPSWKLTLPKPIDTWGILEVQGGTKNSWNR